MKQSVSTTTIFQAVLAFTLLFAGFLAVAVNYNKAYKLKNETVSIVEKYEGISSKSLGIINNYLQKSAYTTTGNCEVGEYGVADLNTPEYKLVSNDSERYYYCLNYFCTDNQTCKLNIDNGNQIFYNVKIFFKFNLPFVGDLFIFKITGDTKAIQLYDKTQTLEED